MTKHPAFVGVAVALILLIFPVPAYPYKFGFLYHEPPTNLSAGGGTETGGQTEVQFSIPLDSGDSFDRALVAGNEYTVLLAYGPTDDFTEKHTYRESVKITL